MSKCRDCQDEYEADSMVYGLCEDCLDNFQSTDAEHQMEKAMYLMELRQEEQPPE